MWNDTSLRFLTAGTFGPLNSFECVKREKAPKKIPDREITERVIFQPELPKVINPFAAHTVSQSMKMKWRKLNPTERVK